MTVSSFDLATLKRVKNSVIGNPTAKRSLAQDDAFIRTLVDCINNPLPYVDSPHGQGSTDDIRVEAAHVIASLSYGSHSALDSLLAANAHQAILYALDVSRPHHQPSSVRSAFTRALRAIAVAIADALGPEQWGLRDRPIHPGEHARVALDYLFQVEALDVFLPLLQDTASSQVSASIAQLLGSAIRCQPYRQVVSEWLPPAERTKELKGKRGWEKTGSAYQAGWVAKQLVTLLQRKDAKLQEAALSALASLTKDNPPVAAKLATSTSDQSAVLPTILALCKSRNTELQIAASLCAANIIRAGHSSSPPYHGHTSLDSPDHSAAMTIVHVINGILSSTSSESTQTRSKACFIVYHLVADDKELCQLAYDRGTLSRLGQLVASITPSEPASTWDEDEPESVSSLREAALTAIAALGLFDNDIRCEITDNLRLIPSIQTSLSHRHVGVRYAACQCVRALSRAVAVLRTNIMDTGLGMAVYNLFVKGCDGMVGDTGGRVTEERPTMTTTAATATTAGEDRRVMFAALAVICNLVNDFSPLRRVLLEQGVISKLGRLLKLEDPGLKLNTLWAFKNLLYKSNIDVRQQVVDGIGWVELASLLVLDTDPGIQEQAFHVVRHLAYGEDGAEMVFKGIGEQALLHSISLALESEDENVVRQAVCLLGNLSNSHPHQRLILSHSRILASLRSCLVDAKVDIRRPAAACILELVRGNPRSHHRELYEAGIDSTLRHMCDYSGGLGGGGGGGGSGIPGSFGSVGSGGAGSPITRTGSGFQMGTEDDGEVKEKAREALQWLEHAGEVGMF